MNTREKDTVSSTKIRPSLGHAVSLSIGVGIGFGIAWLTVGAIEPVPEPTSTVVAVVTPEPIALPPCPTEDSVNCYWDADTMGNGEGTDSVSVNKPAPDAAAWDLVQ